jgi:tryptophan-rich sensory protein
MNGVFIVGWNILFFSHHQMGIAFFQALLLVINIVLLIFFIWRFSPLAASLLLPYNFYLLFSTTLTYNVWMLN